MSANTFTNITPTQAIKAWVGDGSDGTVLFYNGDLTTVLYLSNQTAPQLGSSVPIQPLTPAVLPAAQDWWALSAGPASVASLTVDPGGTYMAPSPAQVAQQINALGLATANNQATQIGHESNIDTATTANLPSLLTGIHLPVNAAQETGGMLAGVTAGALTAVAGKSIAQDMLHANSGTTTEIAALIASGSASGTPGGVPLLHGVPAGSLIALSSTFTSLISSSSTPLSKIAYEGLLQLSTSVTTAPVYATVVLEWLDGTTEIATEAYAIQCGPLANPNSLFMRGPSKGDHLIVTIAAAGGNSVTAVCTIFESSRQYAESDSWLDYNFFVNTGGGTPAPGDPGIGVLANISVSALTPGSTDVWILPVFKGPVILGVNGASSANAITVSFAAVADPALSNGLIGGVIHPANVDAFYPLQLPASTCSISVKNNGATGNVSPTVSLIAQP